MNYPEFGITKDGQIEPVSPRDLLKQLIIDLDYDLNSEEAQDITDLAIRVFQLDSNGKLPLRWKELYRNRA